VTTRLLALLSGTLQRGAELNVACCGTRLDSRVEHRHFCRDRGAPGICRFLCQRPARYPLHQEPKQRDRVSDHASASAPASLQTSQWRL